MLHYVNDLTEPSVIYTHQSDGNFELIQIGQKRMMWMVVLLRLEDLMPNC